MPQGRGGGDGSPLPDRPATPALWAGYSPIGHGFTSANEPNYSHPFTPLALPSISGNPGTAMSQ